MEKAMTRIIDMFDEEWERQAIEYEIEHGCIVSGRLGSPDDYPPREPVLEDEETLRKFLADKFRQMREKVDARKKAFQENASLMPPNLSRHLIND